MNPCLLTVSASRAKRRRGTTSDTRRERGRDCAPTCPVSLDPDVCTRHSRARPTNSATSGCPVSPDVDVGTNLSTVGRGPLNSATSGRPVSPGLSAVGRGPPPAELHGEPAGTRRCTRPVGPRRRTRTFGNPRTPRRTCEVNRRTRGNSEVNPVNPRELRGEPAGATGNPRKRGDDPGEPVGTQR